MSTPQRRENRKVHLDASVVPVERALLARAAKIEDELDDIRDSNRLVASETVAAASAVAAEFRALAEELHWH